MKKIFFGLSLATLALVISAFANSRDETPFIAKIYYQVAPGIYTPTIPATSCTFYTLTPCTIRVENPILTEDYPYLTYISQSYNSVPISAGSITESMSKFSY